MNLRQLATDVDGICPWHLFPALIPDFRPDESAKWITAAAELALAAKSKLNCGAKVPGKALRKTKFGNSAAARLLPILSRLPSIRAYFME